MWLRHAPGSNLDCVAIPVRLFVDPEHRGLGAGKQLMTTALQYTHAQGLILVFDVMLKDRAAIRLYETLGCLLLDTIDHHHGDGQVERAAVYLAPSPAAR